MLQFPHKPVKNEPQYSVTFPIPTLWWNMKIGSCTLFVSIFPIFCFCFVVVLIVVVLATNTCLCFVETAVNWSFFKYVESHTKMLFGEDLQSFVVMSLNASRSKWASHLPLTYTNFIYLESTHFLILLSEKLILHDTGLKQRRLYLKEKLFIYKLYISKNRWIIL